MDREVFFIVAAKVRAGDAIGAGRLLLCLGKQPLYPGVQIVQGGPVDLSEERLPTRRPGASLRLAGGLWRGVRFGSLGSGLDLFRPAAGSADQRLGRLEERVEFRARDNGQRVNDVPAGSPDNQRYGWRVAGWIPKATIC